MHIHELAYPSEPRMNGVVREMERAGKRRVGGVPGIDAGLQQLQESGC